MQLMQPSLLERSHLLARLSHAQTGVARLIAGQGYGKTTLMTMLAKRPDHYYLSLLDADPDPLSIIRLLMQEVPALQGGQLAYELSRPSVTDRAAAAALRSDLVRAGSITLLIDDAHVLSVEGRRFFTELLSRQLVHTRLFFAMHDDSNLPVRLLLPRLQPVGLQVDQLDTHDLMFTTEEMLMLGLNTEQQSKVAGWPAGAWFVMHGQDIDVVARELLSLIPDAETFLPVLRRAALLPVWRETPEQEAMGLTSGWLARARHAGVPMVQLDAGSYSPHPVVQRVLMEDLQAHPQEYLQAQQGHATMLSTDQPLVAVEAFLNAGAFEQARELLVTLVPTLRSMEQLSSLRSLLGRVVKGEADPLYLALAQATFDAGATVEGLKMARQVLQADYTNHEPHVVLGEMNQRIGNSTAAIEHYSQALARTQDMALSSKLRARLVLNLALQSDTQALLRVVTEADHVLSDSVDFESALLARVALVLSLAARGHRTEARSVANMARDYLEGLSPGVDTSLALLHLANFMADDGDVETAKALIARAEQVTGQDDLQLQFYLSRARAAFRGGELQACKQNATVAADLALRLQHDPAHFEATTYLYLLSLLPEPGGYEWMLEKLLRNQERNSSVLTVAHLLRDLFVHRSTRLNFPSLGDLSVPAEFRTLLAAYQLSQKPKSVELREEVRNLRQRLGPGVVASHARLLGVDLPGHLSETRLTMQILALKSVPTVMVQGEVLPLRDGLLLPLLALVKYERLPLQMIGTLEAGWNKVNFRKAISDLKKALIDVTEFPDPLGDERGVFSMTNWRVELDVNQLVGANLSTLTQLYKAPVYSAEVNPPPFLEELRQEARQRVVQKLDEARLMHAREVESLERELLRRDPGLRDVAGR